MSNTNNTAPRFSHDCDCCAHIGRAFDGKDTDGDVWVCLPHRELIIRFSDRPDHNIARSIGDVESGNILPIWGISGAIFRDWQRKVSAL